MRIERIGEAMLYNGDCIEVMRSLPDNSVDSIVTDPPYHLTSIVKRFGKAGSAPAKVGATGAYARASRGFMGQEWDGGDIAFRAETWAHCLRVLKPGGHLAAFSSTRTYHRMAVAIEDAGFEIRDQLAWVYGSGFPKSHDVSKGIDATLTRGSARTTDIRRLSMGEDYSPSGRGRVNYDNGGGSQMNGSVRYSPPATPEATQWEGWGTALKPAWEPIALARKPLDGTVARNVLAHGVGALNINGCRVEAKDTQLAEKYASVQNAGARSNSIYGSDSRDRAGAAPHELGRWPANILHDGETFGERGRFFYCAKASKADRGEGNNHPTVKPTDLMRWLCRLITPPGGNVFDPFTGSGSTGRAALLEGFGFIGAELSPEYVDIALARISAANDNVQAAA